MKKTFGSKAALLAWLALSLLLLVLSSARVQAQSSSSSGGDAPAQADNEQSANPRNMRRRDPLRALNLTPEQFRQIRAVRAESREEWRAVRQRLTEAHRALDDAIYSDNVNEALVEAKAREVGIAQAAVAHMRARTELKIRRLLTPEQLNTLRQMQQEARAAERNGDAQNGFDSRPLRRNRLGRRDGGRQRRDALDSPDQNPPAQRNESLDGERRP